ncbi:MAG: pyrroline-5-carboxylate reductase [Spirochaetes bacterium]|jgi:pyrroline-5-carboxylate reductase|nr:pyrroline-5-carboxylate reductase [Spirochaetota bacterium]
MLQRLGLIGYGNMGEAIVSGLKARNPELELGIVEVSEERKAAAIEAHGARDFTESLAHLVSFSDVVVLAIKPQDVEAMIERLEPISSELRLVSILAGTPLSRFTDALSSRNISRFMPSLAAKVGRAVVGVSFAEGADDDFRDAALEVARAIGTPQEIPEKLMSAVTGVSGSGLAFTFEFIHSLALGATRAGLPYPQALAASLDVLEGATALIRETGEHPISLASRVASPAGTTIEGLTALEEGGFSAAVINAVSRAANRATELE